MQVGAALVSLVADETIQGVVQKMDAFWSAHGLGSITLARTIPLTLESQDCFEYQDLPITSHSACFFDRGVLAAVFSRYLRRPVNVVEKRCYSAGDDRCTFVIKPRPADW